MFYLTFQIHPPTNLTYIFFSLMGPTGSGKSSVCSNRVFEQARFVDLQKFIEKATGGTGIAGHNLQSCTSEVSVFRLPCGSRNLCFVDTPGFDDTNKSDLDILKLISKWLSKTYVMIHDLLFVL